MKQKSQKKKLIITLCLAVLVIIIAIVGKNFTPHNPFKTDLDNVLKAPCIEYPFGTDNLGRCIFSRVLAGASTSIFSALLVVGIVFVVGVTLGVVAGYIGGTLDDILMSVTLIFQAFPEFILAVAVAGILGPGIKNSIIALSFVYWTTYARFSRSLVLSMKNDIYIKAAKVCGANKFNIILNYIFPNIIAPIIVTATLDIGSVILNMAGLSFLGMGAKRPTAEWGVMMNEARSFLQVGPWGLIFPGIALFFVVMIFNLLGDEIRDVLGMK